MYYHFAVLLLFRPFITLRIIASNILPRDVCCQAADAIQRLLRSYSRLYTLRRMPSFIPYFIFTSSVMRLAVITVSVNNSEVDGAGSNNPDDSATIVSVVARLNTKVSEAVSQGIMDLVAMAPFHGFAGRALHTLRFLAAKEGYCAVNIGGSSLHLFTPEENVTYLWGSGTSLTASGSSTATTQGPTTPKLALPGQSSLLMGDPLFCPFPMWGRSILPVRVRSSLDEAGFATL